MSIADGPVLEVVEVSCTYCHGAGMLKYGVMTLKTCPLCNGRKTMRIGRWVYPVQVPKYYELEAKNAGDDGHAA